MVITTFPYCHTSAPTRTRDASTASVTTSTHSNGYVVWLQAPVDASVECVNTLYKPVDALYNHVDVLHNHVGWLQRSDD